MIKQISFSVVLSLALLGCGGGESESKNLKPVWQSSGASLAVPESVVYDDRKSQIYVSNVNAKASGNPWVDNEGFLSLLDTQGKVITLKWITGLKAPKGLALYGDTLYVADLDQVVKINTQHAKIVARFHAPKGVAKLNDLVYDPTRELIYVSDSSRKALYAVDAKGDFSLLYAKEESQKAEQNGLYLDHDKLVMQGRVGYLKSLHLDKPKEVDILSQQINIPIDGITPYQDRGYLVSAWAGEIHFVSRNGTEKILIKTNPVHSADIFYSEKLDLLLVPDFDQHIIAYKVKNI